MRYAGFTLSTPARSRINPAVGAELDYHFADPLGLFLLPPMASAAEDVDLGWFVLDSRSHDPRAGLAREMNPPELIEKVIYATELNQGATGQRIFSWFGRNQRLAKDFENLSETLAIFAILASDPAAPQAACRGVARELNKHG
jgi:hypothetical protein